MAFSDHFSFDEKKVLSPGSHGLRPITDGMLQVFSFDNIMGGATRTPCTTLDYLEYCRYVSHDAENLEFYLWYQDYAKRFAQLPARQKALSPDIPSPRSSIGSWEKDNTQILVKVISTVDEIEAEAESTAAQPFREEIEWMISTYVVDGGALQLNLSDHERKAILENAQTTTHPSAFQTVLDTIEWQLRHQSHPNFIQWTVRNGKHAISAELPSIVAPAPPLLRRRSSSNPTPPSRKARSRWSWIHRPHELVFKDSHNNMRSSTPIQV